MEYYTINGRRMPPVVSINPTWQDLDSENSGRLEDGVMRRERIRSNVLKISIKHEMLTDYELDMIKAETSAPFFSYAGPGGSMTCYRSDYKATLRAHDGRGTRWDVTFNLIEK